MRFRISGFSISKRASMVIAHPMNYLAIVTISISAMAFADTFSDTMAPVRIIGSRYPTKRDSSQILNIYPVRDDGRRDYTRNSIKVEGGNAYQVKLDGRRDWNTPLYIIVPTDVPFENEADFSSQDYYSRPLGETTK